MSSVYTRSIHGTAYIFQSQQADKQYNYEQCFKINVCVKVQI